MNNLIKYIAAPLVLSTSLLTSETQSGDKHKLFDGFYTEDSIKTKKYTVWTPETYKCKRMVPHTVELGVSSKKLGWQYDGSCFQHTVNATKNGAECIVGTTAEIVSGAAYLGGKALEGTTCIVGKGLEGIGNGFRVLGGHLQNNCYPKYYNPYNPYTNGPYFRPLEPLPQDYIPPYTQSDLLPK